jgi:hypothetical protein
MGLQGDPLAETLGRAGAGGGFLWEASGVGRGRAGRGRTRSNDKGPARPAALRGAGPDQDDSPS